MYRLINQNADAVVAAIGRDDVSQYLDLQSQLQSEGARTATDARFQKLYRRYWSMNVARLDDRFYERYFELLTQCKQSGEVDLATVVQELWRAVEGDGQSLQFSFATKLVHMVDPRLPVYDSFVAAFYFYRAPDSNQPFEMRLQKLLDFHQFLRTEYARVLADGLLNEAIRRFRATSHVTEAIGDERIVDWLLWAWVSLLRNGDQQRGKSLYD